MLMQNCVMAWVSPLGLPVYQPYRRLISKTLRSEIQSCSIQCDSDDAPVAARKQASAFPANFVHSLDASHMLMTALEARKANISFAAVHDSFWTSAADVPLLAAVDNPSIFLHSTA